MKPKSILRRKSSLDSSFGASTTASSSVSAVPYPQQPSLKQQVHDSGCNASFNLTETLHLPTKIPAAVVKQESSNLSDTSHTSSGEDSAVGAAGAASTTSAATPASNSDRKVHFDPRVVVTELAPVARIWYTDVELERFKAQTVQIAKSYLIQHPDEIPLYGVAQMCHVTHRYRKKALFGLSALNDLTPEERMEVEDESAGKYFGIE
jgi:hypothetical protein